MKIRLFTGGVCLGLGAFAGPGPARAQTYRPPPTVSPYINLARQANLNPGISYYGIVRPELEFRGSIQRLQQQQRTLGQELDAQAQQDPSALPPTGHQVGFLNQSVYFQTLRPGAAGRQPLAGAAGARPRGVAAPRRR